MRIARHGIPLGVASAVLAAAAPVAHAADPGFTCRASVLRAQLASGSAVEPLAANRLGARCTDDTVGLERLGASVPGDLGLDMAFAATATNGAASPRARTVEARSATAAVAIPGTSGALRAEGVSASVTASCAGATPALAAVSSVARLVLGGNELPTDSASTQILDGLSGLPVGAVLRIVPNEELRSGSGGDVTLTRRALHVTVTLPGETLVDAVVGEATAGTADSACTATADAAGAGRGASGGGRPVAGESFGGGRAVTLAQLAELGVGAGHPCRGRRYGGDVALVGTRGRDAVSGSRFGDRMFGLRRGDRLAGSLGRDCIDGGRGADRLSGSLGRDRLIGRKGRDRAWGGPGRDRVTGGRGRDVVNGESGDDRLFGRQGRDTLNAGYGRDRVFGGRGDDTINAATAGKRQFVDCGRGRDEVRLNYGDRQRRCERVLRLR
jgi:Ca2+-binding RTX toxin-like protein